MVDRESSVEEFAPISLPFEGTLGTEAWSVDGVEQDGVFCMDVVSGGRSFDRICPPEPEITSEHYDAVELMVFVAGGDGSNGAGLVIGVVPPESESVELVEPEGSWTLDWDRSSGVFAMVGPIAGGYEAIRVTDGELTAECTALGSVTDGYSCPSPVNRNGDVVGVPWPGEDGAGGAARSPASAPPGAAPS